MKIETALRNFDPKKSAYIVTDIMAEHVKVLKKIFKIVN